MQFTCWSLESIISARTDRSCCTTTNCPIRICVLESACLVSRVNNISPSRQELLHYDQLSNTYMNMHSTYGPKPIAACQSYVSRQLASINGTHDFSKFSFSEVFLNGIPSVSTLLHISKTLADTIKSWFMLFSDPVVGTVFAVLH